MSEGPPCSIGLPGGPFGDVLVLAPWGPRLLSNNWRGSEGRASALTKTNPPALTFTDPPSAQVNGVGHGRLFPAKPAALHQAAILIPTVRPPARTAGPTGPTGGGSAQSDHHVSAATKLWPAHRCMNAAWAWSVPAGRNSGEHGEPNIRGLARAATNAL